MQNYWNNLIQILHNIIPERFLVPAKKICLLYCQQLLSVFVKRKKKQYYCFTAGNFFLTACTLIGYFEVTWHLTMELVPAKIAERATMQDLCKCWPVCSFTMTQIKILIFIHHLQYDIWISFVKLPMLLWINFYRLEKLQEDVKWANGNHYFNLTLHPWLGAQVQFNPINMDTSNKRGVCINRASVLSGLNWEKM